MVVLLRDRCSARAAWIGRASCSSTRIGRMFIGVTSLPPGWMSQRHVKALGLEPSLPGRNRILRLNCERYSDQRAWQQVSFLVEVKYSRVLWLVTVLIGRAEPSR